MGNDVDNPRPIITTQNADVDLLQPTPDMIHAEDIALAMARIARYNGHSNAVVTLLDHVAVCDGLATEMGIEDPQLRLAILLHDAHEAYTGDIARPIKALINADSNGLITALEDNLDRAICTAFSLPEDYLSRPDVRRVVKQIDNTALGVEVRYGWPQIVAEERWENVPKSTEGGKSSFYQAQSCDPEQLRTGFLARVGALAGAIYYAKHGAVVEGSENVGH